MNKMLILLGLLLSTSLSAYTGSEVTIITKNNIETSYNFQLYRYRYYQEGFYLQFQGDEQALGYKYVDKTKVLEIEIDTQNNVNSVILFRF